LDADGRAGFPERSGAHKATGAAPKSKSRAPKGKGRVPIFPTAPGAGGSAGAVEGPGERAKFPEKKVEGPGVNAMGVRANAEGGGKGSGLGKGSGRGEGSELGRGAVGARARSLAAADSASGLARLRKHDPFG
jgi:hypothetical protein